MPWQFCLVLHCSWLTIKNQTTYNEPAAWDSTLKLLKFAEENEAKQLQI